MWELGRVCQQGKLFRRSMQNIFQHWQRTISFKLHGLKALTLTEQVWFICAVGPVDILYITYLQYSILKSLKLDVFCQENYISVAANLFIMVQGCWVFLSQTLYFYFCSTATTTLLAIFCQNRKMSLFQFPVHSVLETVVFSVIKAY